MIEYKEIEKSIKKILRNRFDIDDPIDNNMSLSLDLNLDSLDIIDLLSDMEEIYNVSLNDKKEEEFYKACEGTIGDIILFFFRSINGVKSE